MLRKVFLGFLISVMLLTCCSFQQAALAATARQMENLDRGVVAVKVSNGVFVSWRVLGTETADVTYNLYRDSVKLTNISGASNYIDKSGTASSKYSVSAVVNSSEQQISPSVSVWGSNYLQIPLQIPEGGTTPDGVAYTYSANDCSVGDLDGDGQYEIILKWDPSNAKDNSQSGYTGNVYIDAYKLNGKRLWRIDLGKNIRAGAHYTQFMVYDLNGDGKAEMACKTSDGTKDGIGNVIGNAGADYRNSSGYVLSGSEYLTIFDGNTGKALYTGDYEPGRGTVSSWGDSYGNRVDRFLACIAYLDGMHPSLVMCRGYYTRAVLVAYDWNGSTLTKRWTFDSNSSGNSGYAGQGNHNLSVADVDDDGKDEIIYGSCTVDDSGKGLYTTGLRHGDSMHLGDLNPNRPGLEVWSCHEDVAGNGGVGASFRDAKTGNVIFKFEASDDVGRACSADLTAQYPGEEVWAAGSPLYSCTGQNIGSAPSQKNFAIWWDGDELRELLDGTSITKYGGGTLLSAGGCSSNNGTKSTPCLQADILGDWREEAVWRTSDNKYLNIYTTTDLTSRRIYTLMHDPVYRLGIAWQNVAYNQPPHTGFFLGSGMTAPPQPSIYLAGGNPITVDGKLIKALTVNDTENSGDWSIQPNLQIGDLVYGDRTFKFTQIPQSLIGSEWIRTACDSKMYTSDEASFTAKSDISVYVGLDTRATSIPAWLNGWNATGEILVSDNNSVEYNIYKKDYAANSLVTLGTNGASASIVNYVVIVKPQTTDFLLGDANGDGEVNSLDYATLKSYLLGKISLSQEAMKAVDFNNDNTIDAIDLALFRKNLLGGPIYTIN
ncbi:dockerin type I domain-containing protein [Clostridium sp. BNL1100]|uniref:rhamnogalacturonan lyase family protein n=1 Tax=Clostridium sp. BNL1100 TaxID=755731 RepID=UPI00024A77B1|nr:dockerin type I domain-containing protein [Clostridium sp. BNL1100]AEY65185.1 dockerin-like protein [Clostridium sp. BNL1100]